MADPTARFVITASDQTKAAIASADRGLRQLGHSVTSIRSTLAGFGVALGGRALLNWVTNAVKAADATGEHAKQIKAAQEAMAAMKKASDDLAVSIGVQLTPAFAGLGKVLQGLNTLFFNADAAPFEQEIKNVQERIREMRKHGIDTGIGELLYSKEDQARIAELQRQLDELIKKQRQALGLEFGADFRNDVAIRNAVTGMRRIGDIYDRNPTLKRPNVAIDELMPLDDLQEMVVEARRISEDELLKPFPSAGVAKMFEPIKDEGSNVAEFLGESFRDAFSSWILGTERSFRDMLKRMAIEMATSALFQGLASFFPGGTFLSKFFGGSRASGGSTREGVVYKVHRGEAFFTPGQDGHVGAAAGGFTYNDNSVFNISGGSSREQEAALRGALAQHKREVMAEIKDKQRRGRF